MVVLAGQFRPELLVEVVDRKRAGDADRVVVDALDRLVREVELVFDLADDLLEQILERDDALHRTVLVDDDRHVLVRAAELGEHRREVLGLRDDVRVAHDLLDDDVRDAAVDERGEEVAHVEDPDDVVERLAVDGIARVRRVDDRGQRLFGR